ncbi:MAG: virulence RhuM family protein, partial [Proteobacteria bacterium]|nr:virulence RhuM family protein [Pseudomonadota bacterium]
MKKNKKIPDNQITVYQTSDGKINIEVLYANENIWLPQKRIAELFDVDRSVITKHLKNIFSDNELEEDSVCAKFAHTAEDGKEYQTKFYSLEAIIAVGYRVNSERGIQFRQWAITILQKYIHKGFAIELLEKQGCQYIYALSIAPNLPAPSEARQAGGGNSKVTKEAFTLEPAPEATMKDKLLWEKELLGLYISGHPLDKYRATLEKQPISIKK